MFIYVEIGDFGYVGLLAHSVRRWDSLDLGTRNEFQKKVLTSVKISIRGLRSKFSHPLSATCSLD